MITLSFLSFELIYQYFLLRFFLILGLSLCVGIVIPSNNLSAQTDQASASTNAETITDLNAVLNQVKEWQKDKLCSKENTLVVFDIDDTIISNNPTYLFKNFMNEISEDDESQCELITENEKFQFYHHKRYNLAHKIHKISPTQYGLNDILESLNEVAMTMGLTARQAWGQTFTHQQLKPHNLQFNIPDTLLTRNFGNYPKANYSYGVPVTTQEVVQPFSVDLIIHPDLIGLSPQGLTIYKDPINLNIDTNILKTLQANKHQYILMPPSMLYDDEHLTLLRNQKIQTQYQLFAPAGAVVSPFLHYPIGISNGVVHITNQNKGVILKSLWQHSLQHINCLIFVDDTLLKIKEVEKALGGFSGIKLKTFYYTRVSAK